MFIVLGRFFLFIFAIFLTNCSTVFYANKGINFKDKRVGIQRFNIIKTPTYDKQPEVSRLETEAFYPYLIEAGFDVYNVQFDESLDMKEVLSKAESLNLDYILTGSELVNMQKSSVFIHNLTVKFVNTRTLKTDLSATFEGPSVRINGVAKRIGKKIVSRVK